MVRPSWRSPLSAMGPDHPNRLDDPKPYEDHHRLQTMHRRYFLRSTGVCATAALAGCTSADQTPSALSVRLDPQPPGIRYGVSHVAGPTTDTPLTLQITIANPDETATVQYGERRRALFWMADVDDPFSTYPEEGVRGKLQYHPDEQAWQLQDPFVITMDYQWGLLGPGEVHREQVVLVNAPTADTPVAVSDRQTIAARTDIVIEGGATDGPTEVRWGFEITQT